MIASRLCLHYSLVAAAACFCLRSRSLCWNRYSDSYSSIAPTYTSITTSLKEEEIESQPPQSKSDESQLSSTLLSVPFYVYEELLWLDNATSGDNRREQGVYEGVTHAPYAHI
jgi:hypothetical protein